jgi:hypothetical protein
MSNDPLTIKLDKLVELIRALGLDPVDPADIRRITMGEDGIEITRYRRDEAGHMLVGFGNKPLTETVTIRIEP